MQQKFRFSLRSGLVAAGLAAVLAAPAWAAPSHVALPIGPAGAAPAGIAAQPAIANAGEGAEIIEIRNRHYKRHHRSKWRHANRHHRPHHHRRYRGPVIGFSLGIVPAYRYYAPQRRVYRYGLSDAHYAWCHDRWRSYRAWDNSYQPYHGPRRQCRSPFG